MFISLIAQHNGIYVCTLGVMNATPCVWINRSYFAVSLLYILQRLNMVICKTNQTLLQVGPQLGHIQCMHCFCVIEY